jgi:hypothetical protein
MDHVQPPGQAALHELIELLHEMRSRLIKPASHLFYVFIDSIGRVQH